MIPDGLKPSDGRFGCGPSKVRPQALARLAGEGAAVMGTSHRQQPVKALVGEIRAGLRELFARPTGMRSRSATAAPPPSGTPRPSASIEHRALHLTYGEFSSKFAQVTAGAPFLQEPVVVSADPGDAPDPAALGAATAGAEVDVVAWAHNETSTGVMVPVIRPAADQTGDALVLIDATSGAGGLPVRDRAGRRLLLRPPEELRRRRRAVDRAAQPRRAGADRGARRIGERWIPAFLSLQTALENSLKDQTYNTPAVASLFLLADEIRWMLDGGGLDWCVSRTTASSEHLYGWAQRSGYATPFVADPAKRSLVVGTIDFDDEVDAAAGREDAAGQRDPRHRAIPQAGTQPAADRNVPGGRARRRAGADACIDWVVERICRA